MSSSNALWTLTFVLHFSAVCPLAASPAAKGPTVIGQKDVPYTITASGSYVLGSNLVVTDPDVTPIFIAASDVTLDLAGFSIQGPDVGGGDAAAINTDVRNNLAVRNGSVRGFHSPSLACVHLPGSNNRVEAVRVESCSLQAIFVGRGSRVEGCQVSSALSGIGADDGSIISGNTLVNIGHIAIGAQGNGGLTVIGNNCRESSTCIQASTDGNRIESNVLTESGVGLDLTGGADNYFARNFLKGNASAVVGAGDDLDGGAIDPALSNVILP